MAGTGVILCAINPHRCEAGGGRHAAGCLKRHIPRLTLIESDLTGPIWLCHPDEMAIEELFFSKNITTGIAVAHARGVILCTAEKMQLPIYEYTPMQVKQAVVGYGLAEKKQVMDMTRRLLKLKDIPRPDDAADALAIAICHARSATSRLRRTDPNVKETV